MISEAYPLLGEAMDEAFGPNQVKLRTAANPVLHAAVAKLGDDPEPGQADLVLFGELEGAMQTAAREGEISFRGIEVPKCPFGADDRDDAYRGFAMATIPAEYFIDYGSFHADANGIDAVSLFWPYEVRPYNVGSRAAPIYKMRHVGRFTDMDVVTFGHTEQRHSFIKVRTEWTSFRHFAENFLSGGRPKRRGRPAIDREMVAAVYERIYPKGDRGKDSWKAALIKVESEIQRQDPRFAIRMTVFKDTVRSMVGARQGSGG